MTFSVGLPFKIYFFLEKGLLFFYVLRPHPQISKWPFPNSVWDLQDFHNEEWGLRKGMYSTHITSFL